MDDNSLSSVDERIALLDKLTNKFLEFAGPDVQLLVNYQEMKHNQKKGYRYRLEVQRRREQETRKYYQLFQEWLSLLKK